MGTRNKTKVIKDGKIIVNQYCQWDGYPTTSTADIIDFIKDNGIERFLEGYKKCEYVDEEYIDNILDGIPEFVFGSKRNNLYSLVSSSIHKIKEEHDYNISLNDLISKLMEDIDNHQYVADYLTLTRDYGREIMELVAVLSQYDVVIHLYLMDVDSWDIEAINTVNLDNNTLTTDWRGKLETWPLDKLPSIEELENLEHNEDD